MQLTVEPASAKARKEKAEPVASVTRGSVKLDIFLITKRVKGKDYPQFEFTYYAHAGAERTRVRRADLEEAKQEAELVATKLANGEGKVLELTTSDRGIYLQACDLLRPLGLPLNIAVSDYVAAMKRLPQGTSLLEAVEFFVRRNPASLPQRTVEDVVKEIIAIKTKAKKSAVYIEDLQGRLGRFAKAFQMPIGQVTAPMIEKHLDTLKASRTKRNHLRLITTLFKFAVKRRYLSKDALDELEVIELPDVEDGEVVIFSPTELDEILAAARPEIVPWIVIGAFCGLRAAELQRLDWSEVDLDQKHVEVPASKAKTASRRLAPLPDCAVEWLRPYAKAGGRVSGFENMNKQIAWLVADVNAARMAAAQKAGQDASKVTKFKWKRNGLRHSFISYRTTEIKDVAQVALEAGNSPTMIFRNYRKVVTEAEAAKWFALLPARPADNVVLLPHTAP